MTEETKGQTLDDCETYYPMCHRRSKDILLMGNATEEKMKEYDQFKLIDRTRLKAIANKWVEGLPKFLNYQTIKCPYCSKKITSKETVSTLTSWITYFFRLNKKDGRLNDS